MDARKFEIGQDLLFVYGCQTLDRFDFNNNSIFHHQIGPKTFIEETFADPNGNGHLACDFQSFIGKCVGQDNFVNRFE